MVDKRNLDATSRTWHLVRVHSVRIGFMQKKNKKKNKKKNAFTYFSRTLVKSAYHPRHMLWVLKRTVSMRRPFWAPKHMLKLMGDKKHLQFYALFFALQNYVSASNTTARYGIHRSWLIFACLHRQIRLTCTRSVHEMIATRQVLITDWMI